MFSKDILANVFFILIIALFIYNYYVNRDDIELKCIISKKDGKEYCVRKRSDLDGAVDLLSNTINSLEELKNYVNEKYPNDDRVKRINEKFNRTKIKETLPTSKFKAYSENKGEALAFCLNTENEKNEELMDKHTLLFVAIHELAHIATVSIGHKEEFWKNFKFLLEIAVDNNLYQPVDYKEKPQEYCGMSITDNPYYDI